MAILPKAYIEKNGDDYFGLHPVGSGPYKFVEWVPGDHITLVAYDGYFEAGYPITKNLIIRIIPESTQRAITLENGEVDFAVNMSATDLDTLKANNKVKTIVGDFGNVHMMMFNLEKAPFDNLCGQREGHHLRNRQRCDTQGGLWWIWTDPRFNHCTQDLGLSDRYF